MPNSKTTYSNYKMKWVNLISLQSSFGILESDGNTEDCKFPVERWFSFSFLSIFHPPRSELGGRDKKKKRTELLDVWWRCLSLSLSALVFSFLGRAKKCLDVVAIFVPVHSLTHARTHTHCYGSIFSRWWVEIYESRSWFPHFSLFSLHGTKGKKRK